MELVKNINDGAEETKKERYDFDKMFSFKKTLSYTREKLIELSQEKSILLIVDELDRCLPSYAIKVLERLHHLFDGIDNITVIISIDKKQLEHSIQQIYGNEVNVDKYLKKFINFSLTLDNGTLNSNFQNKYISYFGQFASLKETDKKFFEELFSSAFDKIDIRTQEKLIYRAKLIHETISNEEQLDPALLCFEIMFVAFSYKKKSDNLYWIPKINTAIYPGLKEEIGQTAEIFLKKSEKLVGTVGNTSSTRKSLEKSYREIKDRLLDKTFWIFATLYEPINNNICFDYFFQFPNSLNKEVELAKKFNKLSKILK